MLKYNVSNPNKLSPEFAARLTQFSPQEKVRVIVLLQVQEAENLTGKRPSREERKAAMQGLRQSSEKSLKNIDRIIKHFEGQALVDSPDLLGYIPIEITSAGVNALAASDAVKAVLEDQRIYPGNSRSPVAIAGLE